MSASGKTNKLPARVIFAFALASSALTGCINQHDGSVMSHHAEPDRRKVAEAHWNSVRGQMKLQVAEEHLNAGRLKEAQTALNEALGMSPTEAKAYQIAARLYLEQGDIAKARDAVKMAAQWPGDRAETEYLAGIVSERYGNLADALVHYTNARQRNNKVPEYVMAAAETLVALNRPADALALIEPRTSDFDGNPAVKMLAARISRMMGLRGPAISACMEARRFAKDDPVIEVEIGLTLLWAEQYSEGIEVLRPMFDAALKTADTLAPARLDVNSPVTPSVVCALANAYLVTQHFADARAILKPIIANDTADVVAWTLFVRATLLDGDAESAATAIATFNRKNEPTAETLLLQAYIAFVRGKHDEARVFAEKAYQKDHNLQSALWLMGRSAQASGDSQAAQDAYARAIALDPQSSTAKAMLAALVLERAPRENQTKNLSATVLPKDARSADNEAPLELWSDWGAASTIPQKQTAQWDEGEGHE